MLVRRKIAVVHTFISSLDTGTKTGLVTESSVMIDVPVAMWVGQSLRLREAMAALKMSDINLAGF